MQTQKITLDMVVNRLIDDYPGINRALSNVDSKDLWLECFEHMLTLKTWADAEVMKTFGNKNLP